jgi:uncharacterized membrane-anchored protein YhcB (DUF1043 family)
MITALLTIITIGMLIVAYLMFKEKYVLKSEILRLENELLKEKQDYIALCERQRSVLSDMRKSYEQHSSVYYSVATDTAAELMFKATYGRVPFEEDKAEEAYMVFINEAKEALKVIDYSNQN